MKLINSHTLEIKKSKFIAYYYEVDDASEVKDIINNLKKEHKKARHIPYAYKINQDMKKSDDKEPSGTSGMPILNIIQKNNLNYVLIAVVRYFGGIKLGAGGLIRAYGNAAKEVIKID
ncbi:MAG TPA: YigZ family protein [Candidatus Caccenecus avistercoris]|nr:YigZ family protein [Candidatus Caccenecus avistercoris]